MVLHCFLGFWWPSSIVFLIFLSRRQRDFFAFYFLFFLCLWLWGMLLESCPSFHYVRGANNPCFCCLSLLASSCDSYWPSKVTCPCALLARRLWCPLSLFWCIPANRLSCDIGFLLAACPLIPLVFWAVFIAISWVVFDQLLSFLYRRLDYCLFLL